MTNTLAGSDRVKSMSTRVDGDLLDDFDEVVEESDRWDSRSDAVRAFMRGVVEGEHDVADGRQPPVEDDLADAYRRLRDLSRGGEWVPEDVVVSELSQHHGMSGEGVRRRLIKPLADRGYVARQSDVTGYTAVRIHE